MVDARAEVIIDLREDLPCGEAAVLDSYLYLSVKSPQNTDQLA